MSNLTIAILTAILLSAVSLLTMFLHPRLAEKHRDADTAAAINKIANIFVVITSLVFGLLITSAKSTFEQIDRNIHAYATEVVLLDRTLRNYGPDAARARTALKAYMEEAIRHPAQTDTIEKGNPDTAGAALDAVGHAIEDLRPSDPLHEHLLPDVRTQYHEVVRRRWSLIEQSEGSIPNPIVGMLIAWLTIIFASYGYRVPGNRVVISMLVLSAGLIAGSLYLVLDLNIPFRGPIRISYQPYHRALKAIEAP